MNVLIVDDSKAIQIILKRALEKASIDGLQLRLAHSGLDALEMLKNGPTDMVLTDYHMPGMSGIELISEMKLLYPNIPVGLITTETNTQKIDYAKACGASFIIHKPFEEIEVIRQVKRFHLKALSEITNNIDVHNRNDTIDITKDEIVLPSTTNIEDAIAEALFLDVAVKIKPDEFYEPHQYPYLLGTIVPAGKQQIRAIFILKSPALKQVCAIFAKHFNIPTTSHKSLEQIAYAFLRLIEQHVTTTQHTSLIVHKTNLVTRPFEKLAELYKTNHDRRKDYFIEVKGFDAFVLTLISA